VRGDEIARKFLALERHVDDLDPTVGQRDELMKAIDRRAIGVECARILRGAEALAHLIVVADPQIERSRRRRMALGAKFLRVAAHRIGDLDAGIKPRLVIVAGFAFEQPADGMQLADVDAAEGRSAQHVHERRRPVVIAGKVHEVFRCVWHDASLILSILVTHPKPAHGRRDLRCGRRAA
jgi:hypothetical protein